MEDFFWQFLEQWSYLGLLLVLLAAGFGVPLPEDIPLLISGVLVYKMDGNLPLMIATGLAGVMLGDSTLFLAGRRYGAGVLEHRFIRKFAKPWLVKKAKDKFERHGAKILFAARFMPGLRSVLFLTAGSFRLPFWKMLAFDGTAALISVPTLIMLGYYGSENIEKLFSNARLATHVMIGVIVAALIGWGIYEYYRNLRKKGRNLEGLPDSPSGVLTEATAPLEKETPAAPTMKTGSERHAADGSGEDASAKPREPSTVD